VPENAICIIIHNVDGDFNLYLKYMCRNIDRSVAIHQTFRAFGVGYNRTSFLSALRPTIFRGEFRNFPVRFPRLITLRRACCWPCWRPCTWCSGMGPETMVGRRFSSFMLAFSCSGSPSCMPNDAVLPALAGIVGVLLLTGHFCKGWMIVFWIMMLAGIVGGKVLLFGARAPRLFYLLALAFLLVALMLLAAPMAVALARPPQAILWLGQATLPLVLVTMALLPQAKEAEAARSGRLRLQPVHLPAAGGVDAGQPGGHAAAWQRLCRGPAANPDGDGRCC
jgi:hypothetical protein